jgi:hypothetical protein
VCKAREDGGDAPGLEEVDLAGQQRGHVCRCPDAQEVETGSSTTAAGSDVVDGLLHGDEVRFESEEARAEQRKCRSPASTHWPRSMPTEAMLRVISASDSSNAK